MPPIDDAMEEHCASGHGREEGRAGALMLERSLKQFEWMLMRELGWEVPFDGGLNDLNLFLCDLTVNFYGEPRLS